jgi:regulator of nucleoside diphosphate kinase
MSLPIIAADQATRLRDLVDQHLDGRDGPTAELLAAELDRATLVEAGGVPADVVAIGSRVRFQEERSRTEREVVLVFPSDANASAGRVSVLAPVGAALLGLRVGDVIDWPIPGGRTASIRILAVQHDGAGQERAAQVQEARGA